MKGSNSINFICIEKVNTNKVKLMINLIISLLTKYVNNFAIEMGVDNFGTNVVSHMLGHL